ncbi:MAG: hypothetical protein A2Y94_01155 [Caldithrix sp. RBG_13_44_9]|nr:MAG: hypothetical protein A2Y94_01155 [Caldithrix sp. RBG_13_44_9]
MRSGFRSSTCRVKKFGHLLSKLRGINLASLQFPNIDIPQNFVRSGYLFLEKGILQIIIDSMQHEDIGLLFLSLKLD